MEVAATHYKIWMDAEQMSKRQKKILGFLRKLDDQLTLSDLLIVFIGDKEVWNLKRMLESINGRKQHLTSPSLNAKQEARNRYMELVFDCWLLMGGKLGGSNSSMIAFFRAAWPKILRRQLPTNAAIVSWAYVLERTPVRAYSKWERGQIVK
jgi:hypothetical protein